mmetsp:Transcript_25440/g.80243  ORF Transcript_25440/g.80243 Transcript_25440/m.80243 type:complete len:288 (-) Transcript_25440:2-865(-)
MQRSSSSPSATAIRQWRRADLSSALGRTATPRKERLTYCTPAPSSTSLRKLPLSGACTGKLPPGQSRSRAPRKAASAWPRGQRKAMSACRATLTTVGEKLARVSGRPCHIMSGRTRRTQSYGWPSASSAAKMSSKQLSTASHSCTRRSELPMLASRAGSVTSGLQRGAARSSPATRTRTVRAPITSVSTSRAASASAWPAASTAAKTSTRPASRPARRLCLSDQCTMARWKAAPASPATQTANDAVSPSAPAAGSHGVAPAAATRSRLSCRAFAMPAAVVWRCPCTP